MKKEESATNTETGVASKDTLKTASDVASVTSSSTASGSASTGASGKDLDKRKSLEDTAKMVSEMKQEPQKKLQEIKKGRTNFRLENESFQLPEYNAKTKIAPNSDLLFSNFMKSSEI